MLARLISHIKEGTIYHAVEVARTDAQEQLFFISIQKKKNALEVVEKHSNLNIRSLSGKIKKNAPLFAVINTDHVLTKVVPASAGDDLAVVNSAFPNIKTEDFYYEWVTSDNTCIVAICRKEYVHAALQKFTDRNIHIAGFSLGVLQITSIKDLIPADIIALPGTTIVLKNKEVETIEKNKKNTSETYEINGITLESSYLIGFAGILSSVLKNTPNRSNFETVNTGLLHHFYNTRFFGFFLKFGLSVILALLLINFFAFNYYYKKAEALQETLVVKSADKDRLQELNLRVNEKQKRIDAILASSSSKSSFYIDKIAAALPLSVLLDKITYQPLEGQVKEEDEISVKREVMVISGASKDSDAFSRWVETMEKWDWIAQVSIRDYDYSSASTSLFKIQITLQHEP